jgi:hypothetical protein
VDQSAEAKSSLKKIDGSDEKKQTLQIVQVPTKLASFNISSHAIEKSKPTDSKFSARKEKEVAIDLEIGSRSKPEQLGLIAQNTSRNSKRTGKSSKRESASVQKGRDVSKEADNLNLVSKESIS